MAPGTTRVSRRSRERPGQTIVLRITGVFRRTDCEPIAPCDTIPERT